MDKQALLNLLDSLAVSLADHGHHWSAEQRAQYDTAVKKLTTDTEGVF